MMERMGENIEQNQKTFRANVRYRLRDALSNLKLEKHGGGNSLHNFTGLAGGGALFSEIIKINNLKLCTVISFISICI